MIAICPAGPPKLMKPSLSQKRNASANETEGAAERFGMSNCSPSRRRIAQRQRLDAMRLNGGETACAPLWTYFDECRTCLSTSASAFLRVAQHLRARIRHILRLPPGLDVGERCPDLGVGQLARERRHVALVILRGVLAGDEAVLGDAEQNVVGMVPGMPTFVVRRRREAAVRQAVAPVRLALELRSMAGGAMSCVNLRAGRRHRGVAWIGPGVLSRG